MLLLTKNLKLLHLLLLRQLILIEPIHLIKNCIKKSCSKVRIFLSIPIYLLISVMFITRKITFKNTNKPTFKMIFNSPTGNSFL